MTAILTSAGMAHIADLESGATPSDAFDGLVLGAGNDDPSNSDTFGSLTQRSGLPFLRLVSGYPKKADTDARNVGRAPDAWTWRFEREAGSPFVASNVAVTNYAGGVPSSGDNLLVHSKQTLDQRRDERLIVWVNAGGGGDPTVVTATEEALENRVRRVASFTARTRAAQSFPNGNPVSDSETRCQPQPGQQVWTAAHLLGAHGGTLAPEHVDKFRLEVDAWDASGGAWAPLAGERKTLDCHELVLSTLHRYDQRWRADGGYNVSHIWQQPRGTTEGTFRLRYSMTLCDGDVRRWTTVAEVRE